MKLFFLLVSLIYADLVYAQGSWVKNTFPGQGHVDNTGPWKTGQGSDRGEWVSAFGVSPLIPEGDVAPLMLQLTDLATLQYSTDGKEFKRANIPLTRGGAVAFNPHNGRVGYALMEGDPVVGFGGWWRTEDKGETWQFMFETPSVRGQRNNLLEVNPKPAFKNHIYVAAGVPKDNRNNNVQDFSKYPIGLYRSIDNGKNWQLIDFSGEEIFQIRFNSDGTVLYVVTYAGGNLNRKGGRLYRLDFASDGINYKKVFVEDEVRNIDINPSNRDKGVLLDKNQDIYAFKQFGEKKTLLTNDFNKFSSYFFIEVNPANEKHIVVYGYGALKHDSFIWTDDGGKTWNGIEEDEERGTFPTWFDYAPINYFSPNYVFSYASETILDGTKDMLSFWPNHPKRVLHWGSNIQKGPLMSEDFGKTFKPFAHGGSFKGTEGAALGDVSGVIGLARNEYGFVLTKNNGKTWEGQSILSSPTLRKIFENHPNPRYFKKRNGNSLDFNPINNNIIIGSFGISPTYIVRSEDFGKTWTNLNVSFQPRITENSKRETLNATKVYWHNQNPDIVYVGPMKSIDGGKTFKSMPNGHYVTGMNEKNGDIVVSFEYGRLIHISYDAGETWGQLPKPPASVVEPNRLVAVTAGTNGTAFDLRSEHDPTKGGKLRLLTGGENGVYEFLADAPQSYMGTWRRIGTGFNLSNDPYYKSGDALILNHVAVDKREEYHNIMYAIVGGTRGRRSYYQQVYKSTDAGETWSRIASDTIEGRPKYVSAQWAEVDAKGNFIYSDWEGLYTYKNGENE